MDVDIDEKSDSKGHTVLREYIAGNSRDLTDFAYTLKVLFHHPHRYDRGNPKIQNTYDMILLKESNISHNLQSSRDNLANTSSSGVITTSTLVTPPSGASELYVHKTIGR